MATFNKVILVGHLGRDPELRYTPSGTPVCDFSIATSERRRGRDGGEGEETTTWFRVSMWGRQAEVANQYLSKGKLVYVEGRLSQKEWTDRDGNKRSSLEVSGTDLQFIGPRGEDGGSGPSMSEPRPARSGGDSRPQSRPSNDDVVSDDDIPF